MHCLIFALAKTCKRKKKERRKQEEEEEEGEGEEDQSQGMFLTWDQVGLVTSRAEPSF